ncbi:MAG: META domain-containing protein [Rhizobiaceae bacterium]
MANVTVIARPHLQGDENRMWIDRRRFVFLLAALPAFPGVATATGMRIMGEVFYRPRIALPENAMLMVRLLDADDRALATFTRNPVGQVPVPFVFELDAAAAEPLRIEAFIAVSGEVRFATDAPVTVELGDLAVRVEVAMRGGSMAPETPPLTGTDWLLHSLAGRPPVDGSEISLAFDDEGRLSGFSGCNWYFGEATFGDAGRISIIAGGDTYAGEMVPGAMQQETEYLEALSQISSYRISQRRLVLDDASGGELLLFRPRR